MKLQSWVKVKIIHRGIRMEFFGLLPTLRKKQKTKQTKDKKQGSEEGEWGGRLKAFVFEYEVHHVNVSIAYQI